MALKKTTGFVLLRIGWEYNDEYYNSSEEDDTGVPTQIFLSREPAVKERDRLNAIGREKETKSSHRMTDRYNQPITRFYDIVEVEMEDHGSNREIPRDKRRGGTGGEEDRTG